MLADPTIHELELTAYEKTLLRKWQSVAARAELIAQFYLKAKYANRDYEFLDPNPGADLTVRVGRKFYDFEVKGTADEDIALSKLKVSSCESYKLIVSGITVLRVMRTMTASPSVAELRFKKHFLLTEEARWRATK